MRPVVALIALVLALAGCSERIADAKARSVEQADFADAGGVRAWLFHTCGSIVAGQRVAEFSVVQTGEHAWTGHVTVENPQAPFSSGIACAIAPGDRYITAAHVVKDLPITVLRMDGKMQAHVLPATVIWSDPVRDIAIVSAPGCSGEPTLDVADAPPVKGDIVAVLGNWDELSAGSVLDVEADRHRFLCSAPTHPGDSGGPIVNRQGQLIGVVSAGMSRGGWTTSYFTKAALLRPSDLTRTAP